MMQRSTPIFCFSHLRWDFVYQRPQHILTRLAADRDVYYFEEPVFESAVAPQLLEEHPYDGVTVLRPRMEAGDSESVEHVQERLLQSFAAQRGISHPITWYYTPMALGYTRNFGRSTCVYDCMDELSMFAFAPPNLVERERELLGRADVVFTGGRRLFYNKRKHHGNVRCFPSAVDAAHFAPGLRSEPSEMAGLPHPRLGFYGVVDERFDTTLLARAADLRPQWQFIIIGPVVKIDPAALPHRPNIHYVGQRSYDTLPAYLEHWDIAMLPFALNDSTRFISPTKTLEYLAAHKPAISTPIADVVDPYGENGLVAIARNAEEFVALAERILSAGIAPGWQKRVDELVCANSWDAVAAGMSAELERIALAQAVAQ